MADPEILKTEAKWIWSAEHGKNTWLAFRKKSICAGGTHIVKIAAETRYWLYINGELVIKDGGLNRGPNPRDGYYDEAAVTFSEGVNSIAILVWYWGNGGRNNVDCGQGGLLFDGAGVVSGEGWKVKRHPAFLPDRPPLSSYLHGGHNIVYDASADISLWPMPDYDDSGWENAVIKGSPPCAPYNNLYKRPIPLWRDYGLQAYKKIETKGDTVIACLPRAAMVSPYLRVKSAENGLTIDIRTDRYIVNGGPGDEHHSYTGYRGEYITRAGENEYELPTALFGEQVLYTIPDGVETIELKYRETGYDCGFEGDFRCDDEFLNKLFQKCLRTLYVCMRDNFMDCPDRERGQWIGDVSVQAPQIFYALSRSSDALLKKCIYEFINWRDGDILRGNVPGNHCGELPSQSLNAVSAIGMISEYYMHTGDRSVLDFVIGPAENYLLLWDMGEDGLIKQRKGNWAWYDHGANIDAPVLENCWYASALEFALSIRENAELRNRQKLITGNFDKIYWKADGYRSVSFPDDRANAMAVLSGLTCKDKYPVIREVLTTVKNSTPYMEGYVLEALFRMGYHEDALKRMKERYKPLVENENSTLWEDFSIMGTRNHAWSGAPLTLLYKWVAGIYPAAAGYAEYEARPNLCGLKWLKATVPTVRGNISLDIHKGGMNNDAERKI